MPKIVSPDGLNDRQRLFIKYYVANPNGARAASCAGYSARSARQIAYELLQRPLIAKLTRDGLDAKRKAAWDEFNARLARERKAMFHNVFRRLGVSQQRIKTMTDVSN